MKSRKASVSLSLLFAVASMAVPSYAQVWWSPGDATIESGKLTEIQDKRKVYVNVTLRGGEDDAVQQERVRLERQLAATITAYKGLELALTPERADMVITITGSYEGGPVAPPSPVVGNFSLNLDAETHVPLDVAVFVRGTPRADGSPRPRSVWNVSSQNVRSEPATAAVLAVEGFIDQLKKLRGEKRK